jgi:hypothetical protein
VKNRERQLVTKIIIMSQRAEVIKEQNQVKIKRYKYEINTK